MSSLDINYLDSRLIKKVVDLFAPIKRNQQNVKSKDVRSHKINVTKETVQAMK